MRWSAFREEQNSVRRPPTRIKCTLLLSEKPYVMSTSRPAKVSCDTVANLLSILTAPKAPAGPAMAHWRRRRPPRDPTWYKVASGSFGRPARRGNGYVRRDCRAGGSLEAAAQRASVNLVPLLLTGVRLHPPGRTDKNLCRCFGAPARRVSLIRPTDLPEHT